MSATAWIEELKTREGARRLLLRRGADVLIVVLLAWLAIDAAFILTAQYGQTGAPTSAVSAPSVRQGLNPTLELADIVNAHLFGSAGGSGTDAPNTSLPLVLAGVIAVSDPDKGQAIIGQNAGSARLYSVGNSVNGGAKLHAVYDDHVLLERNGRLESLRLPRTATAGAPAAAPPGPLPGQQHMNMAANGALFNGLIRVQPVFNQGKLSGYRIYPGGRNGTAVFNQLGLRAGDLITAVNGTALDDQARALEILGTLSSESSATVTVSRNGTPQEVNLNLAGLDVGSTATGSSGDAAQGAAGFAGRPNDAPPQPGTYGTDPGNRGAIER